MNLAGEGEVVEAGEEDPVEPVEIVEGFIRNPRPINHHWAERVKLEG